MIALPVNCGPASLSSLTVNAGGPVTLTTLTSAVNYALFQNTGTADLRLNIGASASATLGFLLRSGGVLEFSSFIPTGTVSLYGIGATQITYLTA